MERPKWSTEHPTRSGWYFILARRGMPPPAVNRYWTQVQVDREAAQFNRIEPEVTMAEATIESGSVSISWPVNGYEVEHEFYLEGVVAWYGPVKAPPVPEGIGG